MVTELIGLVKDIQPNAPAPTLELSFPRSDAAMLSPGRKTSITLIIEGVGWHGTMCNEGHRDVYVHTRLEAKAGRAATCTEILTALSVAHEARLRFEVVTPDILCLDRVLEFGTWPSGRVSVKRPPSTATRVSSIVGKEEGTSSSVRSTFPFGDCDETKRLAVVYWTLISAATAGEERRFEREFAVARDKGFLSKNLFVRVGRWKSVRQTPNYERNSEEAIRAATRSAFTATDDAGAVRALTPLRGVALRTASAILQWMRPDRFPILDIRVVSALGLPKPGSWENLSFYIHVAARVRDLAGECAIDLRTMDRALWAWDRLCSQNRARS